MNVNPTDCTCLIDEARGIFEPDDRCPVHPLPDLCDHCSAPVLPDRNGWFVGADGTSDCPSCTRGHEVDGSPR